MSDNKPPASPGLAARLGLAVVQPRWAFAVAGDRRHAGRSGSDLIAMCVLLVLATQSTRLFAGLWVASVIGGGYGLRAVTDILTRSLALDLTILMVGAIAMWAAAGPRRNLGRAFDLACVAALPLLYADLAFTTALRGLGFDHVPRTLMWVFSGVAWGWTGALFALAMRQARVASSKIPMPPPEVVKRARAAGWGVLAVAVAGIAIQGAIIARNLDDMRPVREGEPVAPIALQTIVDGNGALGPVVDVASLRGQVVVVDFWATWCHPCIEAMPALEALARRPGVRVLAINLDDPVQAYAMFKAAGYHMTLLADDDATSKRFAVTTIPHTVVIDREGLVRAVFRGPGDVKGAVDALVK